MCNCGCNTCETKGPLLTEGKVKSLLSEGLQYHIDKKIPLFETVYRIGSDKHLSLIKEARKMYSRNVIDLCEEDEALIKTHLGEFALYEGVSIPLDLPMLNESYDYDEVAQSEFGMDYDQLGSGEKEWVRDEIDNMSMNEAKMSKEKIERLIYSLENQKDSWHPSSDSKKKAMLDKLKKDLSRLNEIDNMSMNESDSNYPDFDLNKNIRYQDTSISSGMWRYTGKEQGGKGVYRNLNNGQILGFDRSDFDIFRKNLSSHFDFSESLNENEGKAIITFKNDYEVKMNTGEGYDADFEHFEAGEREQVYILDKNAPFQRVHVEFGDGTNAFIPKDVISVQEKSLNEDIYDKFLDNPSSPKGRAKSLILKFTKEYGDDASSMAVDRFASKNNLKPEEKYILKYITKNDIKISSQPGGPDFSALNEADDKLLKIKQELEALRPGTISWIDDIFISSYDGSLQVELDYTLYPDEIKQLAQIAAKYGMELKYMTGKNATLVKRIDEAVKNALTEKKAKKKEKKDPPLNKPKRGGSKAYYVYVRDPKTKKIKKVSFGSGGLRAKIKNKEARNAFAARHKCSTKKDRTKAGYWSCNLPRYAPALGLGAKMNTFW
ncbi:hypothetical protein N9034_00525 [bacterium]|nr:hypothetical protein [bacterium]